jgi:DNA polymerase
MASAPEPSILDRAARYLEIQHDLYGPFLFLDMGKSHGADVSDAAADLERFRESIETCSRCGLSRARNRFVFGTGNPDAGLVLVGEAPGEVEDRIGEPFVGAAGQLLDRILEAIGFKRSDVYIANVLKCRPPGNRDPLPEEVANCLPALRRQIAIIQPRLLLALGRVAAQHLLGTQAPLSRLRGTVHRVDGIPCLVTFHPAALLRNPEWKRPTWEDVQHLRQLYDELVGDKPGWTPPNAKP